MNKIWIVEGSTGEYSDHCYWQVFAFTTEEKALSYTNKLNDWCKEHRCLSGDENSCRRGDFEDTDFLDEENQNLCPLDKDFKVDYTGTRYYHYPLEIKE